MTSSESIDILAAALVAAQKEFSPALKTSVNPHYKSKYVDLASAIEAAQPSLLKNGLAVIQGAQGDPNTQSITVNTRILHSSGQWIQDSLTLPAVNRGEYTAQSVGSALTYCRRYSYMAILGFAPEDDDGNAASGKKQEAPKGMPEPEILERLEFIKGSSTLDELQKVFTSAYKLASDSGDKRAMQAFIAGKDARKKELQ